MLRNEVRTLVSIKTFGYPFCEGRHSNTAYKRLDAAREEIKQYLPDDFEPERELEEATLALLKVIYQIS